MSDYTTNNISYEEMSQKQLIDLLRMHKSFEAQRNLAIEVLIEHFKDYSLTDEQNANFRMFLGVLAELELTKVDTSRAILGILPTLN